MLPRDFENINPQKQAVARTQLYENDGKKNDDDGTVLRHRQQAAEEWGVKRGEALLPGV